MNAADAKFDGIIGLAREMHALQQRAAHDYKAVVDDIVLTQSRDIRHIEHTLDRLLDFCGHESVLELYKKLCRHYWNIDPAATADYINAYREYWDSDEAIDEAISEPGMDSAEEDDAQLTEIEA